MRKLVIFIVLISCYQFSSAQAKKTSQEGYNTGCELATAYSQGDSSMYRLYTNTITNPNFPIEYKNGVVEGWTACKKRSDDRGCPDKGCDDKFTSPARKKRKN
ncbi:hypothetical protein [Maribacter sp. 2-571]|uniref:hypothetical protein n=1 Tax=Maribacter sp. 2-571 TaxID=3417569 RepID=UPI003D354971